MSVNTLGLIIVGCAFIASIGMALWVNRPAIKQWFDRHHLHFRH